MKWLLFFLPLYLLSNTPHTIGDGAQPHISRDTKGRIRVVYGLKDKIYCATSGNNGLSFSSPVLVAEVPGMHLGMSRGPQIASSAHYSIITAMDKTGDIHCFRLDNWAPSKAGQSGAAKEWKDLGTDKEWKSLGTVNDLKGSSPEGLMSITADKNDNFYAVWLDIRTGKRNEVYFSTLSGQADHWSPNTLIYQSPDGHVCECCKPNIYAEGKEVAVMFRNWLGGSRDLYLLRSSDKGRTFEKAKKLGEDTWQLNGCPMDGGGVVIDASGTIHTVWQRKGFVYYCKPGEKEVNMGKGRECSIAVTGRTPILSMQDGDTLELVRPYPQKTTAIGNGSFLQSMALSDNKVLCVWEKDNTIQFNLWDF